MTGAMGRCLADRYQPCAQARVTLHLGLDCDEDHGSGRLQLPCNVPFFFASGVYRIGDDQARLVHQNLCTAYS